MIERITLEEYLGHHGVGFPTAGTSLDKCRFPHGLSERQHRKMMQDSEAEENQYAKRREKCTREYYILLQKGMIAAKSRRECSMQKAKYGHPDNPSVQAARRMCDKRNWDWKNYDPETYTEE